MKRTTIMIQFSVIALLLAACSSGATKTAAPDSGASPSPSPTPATPAARTPTRMSTTGNVDGTTVVTTFSDGSKTEVRHFNRGRVSMVTRLTAPDGVRTVRLTNRADNKEIGLDDPEWIEKALDATPEALAAAAKKSGSKARDQKRKQ